MKKGRTRIFWFFLALILVSFQLFFTTSASAFQVGDRVKSTENINVRNCTFLWCDVIGVIPQGGTGRIIGGSYFYDNYTWWSISWDNGLTGFSVQNYLAVIPGTFSLSYETPVCDTNPPGPSPAVRLNWTTSSNTNYYDVYRNGSLYASSNTGNTFYNSGNLVAGQTYSYFIKARNSSGSQNSNTISVSIPSNVCAIPSPQITIGPSSLNFGSVQAGSCSLVQFSIQHISNTDTASGSVSISQNPPFRVTSNSSFSLSNGQAVNVGVQFCPSGSGSFSGAAVISSNAVQNINSVSLIGTGSTPSPTTGAIQINAKLDGSSWSGSVNYSVSGAQNFSGNSVPADFQSRPQGNYTLAYVSGGPANSTFTSITPSSFQSLNGGSVITYTLNFTSSSTSALDHFVFSNISSQKIDVAFSVTIKAVDASGNRMENFNGSVSLTSSLGSVSPTTVNIVNGQSTVSVRLYNPGNTLLNCSGYGKYGNSNYFDLTGASACTGKVFGKVIDARGDVVYKADVTLFGPGGLKVSGTQTDANGEFSFKSISCGTYDISAIKNGHSKTVSKISVSSTLPQILDDIRLQINSGSRGTPVILVPGMMGSTSDSTQVFPVLTAIPGSHNLTIWDYEGRAGWKSLDVYLNGMDFKVFKCSWDWRMKCEEAYKEYLLEKIDEALHYSTTGKVDIVAHSMGGLVVRAYIQSSDYRGDIDKVAMVGTPHLGSCNPYYIWEGGDPKAIDDITTKFWDLDPEAALINAYSRTINELLGTYHSPFYSPVDYSSRMNFLNPLEPFNKMPHEFLRFFVVSSVPSLRQLIYTEDFLKDKNGLRAITTDLNENVWLKGLNQGDKIYTKPSDRMSAKKDGKVQVKLFVGTKDPENYSTIAYVKTLDQDNPNYKNYLYKDGIPKQPMEKNVVMWDGDGTVPYDSATWPLIDGWANIEIPTLEADHVSLIRTYRDQITTFLMDGVSASRSVEKSSEAKKTRVTPSSKLSFSVAGNVRLMITNPDAKQTGIQPDTGNPVEQIPSSKSIFSSEGGGVSVESPAQGTYSVTFFGEIARDFRLNIGFSDGEITEIKQFRGFCPAAVRTFTVSVVLSGTSRITVALQANAPTGFKADPYTSRGVEYTRLTWSKTGEADITGYNVYSVAEQEPYFVRVATLTAGTTAYDSTDQWSSDASTKVMNYAVTAVKSGDAESFFSILAQNNDRDHDWITDEKEASLGTDPNKADTDGDGLKDGDEQAHGTNPLVKDTDGDGYNDYVEIQAGTDPLDPQSAPAATLHVEPGGACGGKQSCYSTIQAAMNAAKDGDTVKVGKGTYKEAPVRSTTGAVTISGGWNSTFTDHTGTSRMYAPRATGGGIVKMLPNIRVFAP